MSIGKNEAGPRGGWESKLGLCSTFLHRLWASHGDARDQGRGMKEIARGSEKHRLVVTRRATEMWF